MKTRSKTETKIATPKRNYLLLLSAVIVALIAFVIRIHAFSSPVFGDEAVYSILGELAIQGSRPYLDFYEMKPPLMFYTYGLGTSIFGWSVTGLRLLGFFIVLLNCGFLFMILRKFARISLSLLISAYAFYNMNNIFIFGTETVSEHFVLTFVLSGYYFLLHRFNKAKSLNIIIAGFLIAGAAMIKQTAGIFGIGAIVFLLVQSFSKIDLYKKRAFPKNIIFLASGAALMFVLNLLPIIISGSLQEAKYWLIEYPTAYTSSVDLSAGMQYLKGFGMRIMAYQPLSSVFMVVSLIGLLVNFRKAYFHLFLILILCAVINIVPGYRFYGQYWLPLAFLLPICLLGLNDLMAKFKIPKMVFPLVVLAAVVTESVIQNKLYFKKDYLVHSKRVYSGNLTLEIDQMLTDLKKTILPHESFGVLGIEAYAYLKMGKFPKHKDIYPTLIGRDSPANVKLQEDAIKEIKEADYDYLFYSLTGRSWRPVNSFNDFLYVQVFDYVRNNYEPIHIFNEDEYRYYSPINGDQFDWYKQNQFFTLRKKRK